MIELTVLKTHSLLLYLTICAILL